MKTIEDVRHDFTIVIMIICIGLAITNGLINRLEDRIEKLEQTK